MDSGLRRAWTQIVTAVDYEEHMTAIGQAQAGAALTQYIIQSAKTPAGGRVAIVGAGTGQMLDFLDPAILRPFRMSLMMSSSQPSQRTVTCARAVAPGRR